eukprot:15483071-Alexandrium_andersonii.AAC.1
MSSCHPLEFWAMIHWNAQGMAGVAMHRWIHGTPCRASGAASTHGTGGERPSTAGWRSVSKMGRSVGRK